jgi:parvulin-like peptidyl-prolyl isomerase
MIRALALLLLLLAAASPRGELVDRIVAVVDDDPIFLSDVERVIRLGLTGQEEGESADELRRRVLDELVDQRLRLHEVQRFALTGVSAQEVDRQLALVRDRFEDEAEYRTVLEDLGFDEDELRHLLTLQLRVLNYIEERLRPRVFVDLADVRSYYDNELAAEMERRGEERPPLSEVRESIRFLLTERRLNEEIEAWTEELRLAADVEDYLDRGEDELPPVVKRIDG